MFLVKKWKEERVRMQPSFTKNVIRFLVPTANDLIGDFVTKLENLANGREFDIKYLLTDLLFDIVSGMFIFSFYRIHDIKL